MRFRNISQHHVVRARHKDSCVNDKKKNNKRFRIISIGKMNLCISFMIADIFLVRFWRRLNDLRRRLLVLIIVCSARGTCPADMLKAKDVRT